MTDNGPGIGAAQFDAATLEDRSRRLPGAVQPFVRQGHELRNPLAHVVASRVELLTLADWIEDAEIRRSIGAAARAPLPAQGVLREVGIHERVPKPARAL